MGDTSLPAQRSPERAEEGTVAPADAPIEVDVFAPRLPATVSGFSSLLFSLRTGIVDRCGLRLWEPVVGTNRIPSTSAARC